MSRVTNANPYTKEKIFVAVVLALIIGFIVGSLLILDVGKDNNEDIFYDCDSGDVFYIKDKVCGDQYGNNTYNVHEVVFSKDHLSGLSVTDLKLLLEEKDLPEYMKNLEHFYIETGTEFAIESSLERQEQYDGDIFLKNAK